jgi:two-component system, chemotaxis family, sensor kinase CheA
MDISKFRQKFIEEAGDLLRKLDVDLLALEKDPNDPKKIDQVFRVMHSLKGSSGMFGFDKITEITHDLESMYDEVRCGKIMLSQPLTDLTFAVGDHIRNLLLDEECQDEKNKQNHSQIKANIEYFISHIGMQTDNTERFAKPKSSEGVSTFHILFNPDETIIKRCINLSITFHDLFLLGSYRIHPPTGENKSAYWSIFLVTPHTYEDIEDALLFVMDYCRISKVADFDIFNEELLTSRDIEIEEAETRLMGESLNLPLTMGTTAPTPTISVAHVESTNKKIHVEASKLDNLMYLVSELVTARSELLLSIEESYNLRTIEAAERIDKLSKLFSDNALSIRLVSMEEMLSRFQRLVRDLSKSLGKHIEFVTEGAETELDKNIIDAIAEPIMHLVRNCIDHGIEMPDVRKARGKAELGKVLLSAYKSGNYVYIKIGDDGNGIDKENILRKAIEKGIVADNALLSEKEIFDLIFLPGFSTATVVSEVSGRGVGMDIVWRKIKEIRGEVSIESQPLIGTTFHIKLQQTISIIDTLLVSANSSKFAIPIEDVEICGLELQANILEQQSNLIEFNNELIPYVSLNKHLLGDNAKAETVKLIIINKQNKRYAIVADRIIGEFQAVVKPLGSTFAGQEFLSGASIYGDGSIVLLIDTEKLKNQISILNS